MKDGGERQKGPKDWTPSVKRKAPLDILKVNEVRAAGDLLKAIAPWKQELADLYERSLHIGNDATWQRACDTLHRRMIDAGAGEPIDRAFQQLPEDLGSFRKREPTKGHRNRQLVFFVARLVEARENGRHIEPEYGWFWGAFRAVGEVFHLLTPDIEHDISERMDEPADTGLAGTHNTASSTATRTSMKGDSRDHNNAQKVHADITPPRLAAKAGGGSACEHRSRRRRVTPVAPRGWIYAAAASAKYDVPRSTVHYFANTHLLASDRVKSSDYGQVRYRISALEAVLRARGRLK